MDDLSSRYRGYNRPRPASRPSPQQQAAPAAKPAAAPRPSSPPGRRPEVPDLRPSGFSPPPKRKKGGRKKFLVLFVALLLVLSAGAGAFWYLKGGGSGDDAYTLGGRSRTIDGVYVPEQEEAPKGNIRLIATGDMIAHDSINQNARKADGSYDYVPLMEKMKPYFDKADIRFCNQSTPAGGAQFGISGYPTFNAPVEFARGLEGVGCNLINIGTNHTNDKGQPLIDATVAAWDDREGILAVAGANRSVSEQNRKRIFETKGLKFAFLSYTTYSNNRQLTPHGVNMYSETLATQQMKEARDEADFVIVSMRWGTEYSPDVNTEQDRIAQKLASLGADVVLGHGPHVLQPVKKLKGSEGRDTIVWYSLGNFLNSQIDIETLVGGFAVMDIDAEQKKISKVSFLPVYMHYEWTAEQKRRQSQADLLARKNFTMVPLDEAAPLLAKSQNGTTVEAQTSRVRQVLNKFTEIPIIKAAEY
jgi:poly-gamma-glutamate capsule biosynthesis protein CapA/YwtB (metallophosphatase superfamily)